jgi:uncharacterized UBP type Zn finger protein
MRPNRECKHLESVSGPRSVPITPSGHGCKECLERGDWWIHLRLCMICGHVGCCDDSPNRHATAHFHATQHPVIKSYEPGEDWAWCYVDEVELDRIPAFPVESPTRHFESPAGLL